jgi:hypothetical protein
MMRLEGYGRRVRAGLVLLLAIGAWLTCTAGLASAVVVRRVVSSFEPPVGGELLMNMAVDNSAGAGGGDVYLGSISGSLSGTVYKLDAAGAPTGVSFTGAETPQGSFSFLSGSFVSGIAVDASGGAGKGDVYVADIEHGVVDRFDASGHYVCQITGSVAPSLSECDALGSATPQGSMMPTGVAVDLSGDVYVADAAHDVIDEFGPGGEYKREISDAHIVEPGELAVDSSGDVYVADGGLQGGAASVVELNANGSFVAELENVKGYLGLAIDPANDHLFVRGNTQISEFGSSGTELDVFGGPKHSFVPALAVAGASDEVYEDRVLIAGVVNVYGPPAVVPEASTSAATDVRETGATFNGHVAPDTEHGGGAVSECAFEYVTDAQFQANPESDRYSGASKAQCSQPSPPPYAQATSVSANATLSPSTTYHFRLVAGDAGGSNEGADETVTTSGPAGIEVQSARAVVSTATVRAAINPFGLDTTCRVQYVEESVFAQSGYANAVSAPCAPADLGSGFGSVQASVALAGLKVNTTYHFRFIAANASRAGMSVSADETFATFGVKKFTLQAVDSSDKPYTQAGGHPYDLITHFNLNTSTLGTFAADGDLKDVIVELPPGIIANADAIPKCTRGELTSGRCEGATQVGQLLLRDDTGLGEEEKDEGLEELGFGEELEPGIGQRDGVIPLYNMVPPAGAPVEFGGRLLQHYSTYLDSNLRTGGDYGATTTTLNITNATAITGVTAEIWGVPADPSHDGERACPVPPEYTIESGPCSAGVEPRPYLINPTSCGGPRTATLRVDSWQEPGAFASATTTMPPITGCNKLYFPPSISVLPDTSASDSPSGVSVNLLVHQSREAPESLVTPSLREAVVTLPAGVTLNPADANGLAACSPAQIALESSNEPTCPEASKVGSVEIETPLLPDRLTGSVYLAEQDNNPFGSLLALYVTAQADGVLVKVSGHVEPDPLTGQLRTTFANNPQVAFSSFKLHFFGGPRAPLATPKVCGSYTTTSVLTPWSAPESGSAASLSTAFQITTGPGGAPCSQPGFAPGFTAGTTSNQAGGFTPFTFTMSRGDGEQNLGSVTTALPPGLVGMLSNVPSCGEPQASEGSCPAASQVGHVTVGVGAGPYPLQTPEPGKPQDPVYLTGPYKGAPFGLSVVVPAEAGPFNLDEGGRPVVVRAGIYVDRVTSAVTVVSDPVPQILQGVPLDVRLVNVTIDRPQFIVNPTNCEPLHVGGALTSAQGLSASLSVPFQVTNCAALSFQPRLEVSAGGHPTRLDGASLTVKLSYPPGSLGKEANIRSVKVALPKQLPSRLGTLQKACLDSTFNANPSACPAASVVGSAVAKTPILPGTLTGPAYFVSHGGAKFPELIVVLSGDGVSVDLDGETFISEAGITSSTFATVPDVPVESFQLTLPQGPYSALGANANLCKSKLAMPTRFAAQNGAIIETSTKVLVTGCGKKASAKRKPLRHGKHKGKHGKARKAASGAGNGHHESGAAKTARGR